MRTVIVILLTMALGGCAGAYVAGDVGAHRQDNVRDVAPTALQGRN